MAFGRIAGAYHYTDLAWMEQWKFVLSYLCLLMVAGMLQRAAALRLVANGYPPRVKQVFGAAWGAVMLLTIVLLVILAPGIARAANGLLAVLTGSLGVLGFAAISLISAWLLPPRRRKSVAGPRRRRHHYRRWIPVPVAWGLLDAVLRWHDGDRVMPWVIAAGGATLALTLIVFERNYRNQEDAASALNRRGSVLLLRTFTRDLLAREEGRLAVEVRRQLGDFIALGNPREVLPPGGGTRHYVADGVWRAHLTELAVGSRAILMWPDATPAVRSELGMIRGLGLHRKLFVVVPPPRPRRTWLLDNHPSRLLRFLCGLSTSDWSEFAQALQENGFGSPEHEPRPGSVLAFEPDGRCVVLAHGLSSARGLVARIAEQLTVLAEPAPSSDPDRPRGQAPRNPDAVTGLRRWRASSARKPRRQLMTNIVSRIRKEAG